MAIHILPGDLDDPRVVELLTHHHATAHAATPKGSAHALDVEGLKAPQILFFAAWDNDTLVGVGALKILTSDHGEIKSMHTLAAYRGRGVGADLVRHLVDTARSQGLTRLSLETGSFEYFAPARALYRGQGFEDCDPFDNYRPDRNSVFMTLDLTRPGAFRP